MAIGDVKIHEDTHYVETAPGRGWNTKDPNTARMMSMLLRICEKLDIDPEPPHIEG